MARIKDTDYLAISARVRAMETTLMTPERMERLLEARSEDEVTRLLQDCGYPALDAARPERMDAALSERHCWPIWAAARRTPDLSTFSS